MTPENATALDCSLPDLGNPDTLPFVLEAAKDSVLDLLSRTGPAPSAVRVTVGPVTVQMDWPLPAPVAAPVQAAPAPAVAAPATPGPESETPLDHLHAPTVGVFYRAPEPGARPFVTEDEDIVPGQQVGIIEAMKLMIPVESDRHGRVAEILQPNGALVEYGDPLFALTPTDGL